MKVLITGTTSGIGSHIHKFADWDIVHLNRDTVDFDYPDRIWSGHVPKVDVVINNAGHDMGGKVMFADHAFDSWQRIINTNLVSAMRITQLAIQKNPDLTVVNITSTNLDRYWGNDLVYTLTKAALLEFGKMLMVDYPSVTVKEVRLGLTRTEFNANRHKPGHKPMDDLYGDECLDPFLVASKIVDFVNDHAGTDVRLGNTLRIKP